MEYDNIAVIPVWAYQNIGFTMSSTPGDYTWHELAKNEVVKLYDCSKIHNGS